ncbi:MAG: type II 3-dehydroquinate dehydratase [Clostridia bacterium]|nr:type II 3-dehydroquinate dehydratase [Clostridia bacterium]
MRFLIMNGPNLNLLGIRAPEVYGRKTYADLCGFIQSKADELSVDVDFYQSNHEGDLIDRIHSAMGVYDGIIFNAGAYTHYSYALHDAIESVPVPVAEVHISDIDARESFRRISVIRPACAFTISGKGFEGYTEALSRFVSESNQ